MSLKLEEQVTWCQNIEIRLELVCSSIGEILLVESFHTLAVQDDSSSLSETCYKRRGKCHVYL